MSAMTRATPASTYDDDFFAWTQEQAAALRQMPKAATGTAVDFARIAEEIEDLGKRDLREVSSYLERLSEHLIKIYAFPSSREVPHWRGETRRFRRSAARAFSPGMRQLLDVRQIWRDGLEVAQEILSDMGVTVSAPSACPFKLDNMLSKDFDIDVALAMLAEAGPRRDVP